MNEAVAAPEAAPAETTAPEETGVNENASQSPGDNGTVNSNEGLLEGSTSETTPDFTSDATQDADPSKAPSTVERPAHIPKHYWNEKTGKVNEEALAKGYNEIRSQNNKLLQQLDGKGIAPETADGYLKDYMPPHRSRPSGDQKEGDPLDRFGDIDAADPMIVVLSKAAKNANLSKGQFDDFIQDFLEGMNPILPEPFNAEKEMASLGENGKHMVDTNKSWIDRLASRGVLNENQYNLLLKFGSTAEGVLLTNALRMDNGEKPIPVNASVATGRKTPDECSAMMADLRYNQDGPGGDAYRAEVDKAFAETYGTEAA